MSGRFRAERGKPRFFPDADCYHGFCGTKWSCDFCDRYNCEDCASIYVRADKTEGVVCAECDVELHLVHSLYIGEDGIPRQRTSEAYQQDVAELVRLLNEFCIDHFVLDLTDPHLPNIYMQGNVDVATGIWLTPEDTWIEEGSMRW